MSTPADLTGARRNAEATLQSSCTVTRPGVDTVDNNGAITTGTPSPVWAGLCSISPETSTARTATRGDDRMTGGLVVRIPATRGTTATTHGDPATVMVGDTLTIDGVTYVARAILDRTIEVLRRVQVVVFADAEQVPR